MQFPTAKMSILHITSSEMAVVKEPRKGLRYYEKLLCLLLIFCAAKPLGGDDSWIDEEHLNEYPFCGSMATDAWNTHHESEGRVVNAEDAKKNYRWVVFLQRHNIQKPIDGKAKSKVTNCVGTVITDRQENIANAFHLYEK